MVAPFVGSFLGVLIRRLPADRPVAVARSACEVCGHRLGVVELIPIASFLIQRGSCRACGARIAREHLAIELAAILIPLSAILAGDGGARLWLGALLGWGLLALGWIDARHFWLPDVLTLPLVVLGLLATALLDPDTILDHALGAALGYGAFRAVGWLYRRLRGRSGLGQGDAKLLAAAGAWLGWAALPQVVLVGAVGGICLAISRRIAGERLSGATRLPFGTALAAATWIVWLSLSA